MKNQKLKFFESLKTARLAQPFLQKSFQENKREVASNGHFGAFGCAAAAPFGVFALLAILRKGRW